MSEDSLALQIRKDLYWVARSPSLLGDDLTRFDESLETVRVDKILEFFESPGHFRVGRYFESLVSALIANSPDWALAGSNLVVRDGKRTIGEIDFLMTDASGHTFQLEVAVKFYLCGEFEEEFECNFIGPNARDTLSRKRARLLDHQLRLGERFGTGICSDLTGSGWLTRGVIFYPFEGDFGSGNDSLLSPGHSRGLWVRASELERFFSSQEPSGASTFRLLRKPFWLSGDWIDPVDFDREAMISWCRKEVTAQNRPALFASGSEWDNRLFVVPPGWPSEDSVR
ncbi:MAG: DUF1853 family protein [Verrucomicrobiota bacterium]